MTRSDAGAARAVILAAGRGRRLRVEELQVELTPEQRSAADAGLKMLMPLAGRPFLDWQIEALTAAGVDRFCLVTPPHSAALDRWIDGARQREYDIERVVQRRPLGTADALLAAEPWVRGGRFLMVNSDNYYPAAELRRLAAAGGDALLAIDRDRTLSNRGGPTLDRLADYALLEVGDRGRLLGLGEKPGRDRLLRQPPPALLSVNAWKFDGAIFDRCRAIEPSARGELELPSAVALALGEGQRIDVVVSERPVLDLSTRRDVAPLVAALTAEMQ